jgi:poly(hydroxyalkanoate) depolymerase family esterase
MTLWSRLAEEKKFAVLYPNLRQSQNQINCWDWYDPAEQAPGGIQMTNILHSIQEALRYYPIQTSRIYITGISAGAAMAANLVSCFPNLFAAAGFHSGMSYGLVSSWQEALEVAQKGPQKKNQYSSCNPKFFSGGVFVIHGSADPVIDIKNSDQLVNDFIFSKNDEVTSESSIYPPEKNFLKISELSYKITNFKRGSDLIGQNIRVEGLGHAWSGGKPHLLSDPRGPSATRLMWNFFEKF